MIVIVSGREDRDMTPAVVRRREPAEEPKMTELRCAERPADGRPRERLLDRIAGVLACPDCHAPLGPPAVGDESALECPRCGARGHRHGAHLEFRCLTGEQLAADWLNWSKERTKRRFGRLYPLAMRLLSPVYGPDHAQTFLRSFDTTQELVADLGSGTKCYNEHAICVDGAAYHNVHVVADLERLPFRDDSLAGLLSIAVLEHVTDPAAHVREMARVLRPGGRVLCYIPFIQGFHASPDDYQRYTLHGMRQLFHEFEVLDVWVGAGPTSGMLWVVQEWLALILSFGSLRLYRLLVPLTWLLSPLKYIDVLLARHPAAHVIASGHYIEARKRPPAGVQSP
jgi:SAM-dependent methyltransferase